MLNLKAVVENLAQRWIESCNVLVPKGVAGRVECGLLSSHVPHCQPQEFRALHAGLLILHCVRWTSFGGEPILGRANRNNRTQCSEREASAAMGVCDENTDV